MLGDNHSERVNISRFHKVKFKPEFGEICKIWQDIENIINVGGKKIITSIELS
jgi:hypothetical protein